MRTVWIGGVEGYWWGLWVEQYFEVGELSWMHWWDGGEILDSALTHRGSQWKERRVGVIARRTHFWGQDCVSVGLDFTSASSPPFLSRTIWTNIPGFMQDLHSHYHHRQEHLCHSKNTPQRDRLGWQHDSNMSWLSAASSEIDWSNACWYRALLLDPTPPVSIPSASFTTNR